MWKYILRSRLRLFKELTGLRQETDENSWKVKKSRFIANVEWTLTVGDLYSISVNTNMDLKKMEVWKLCEIVKINLYLDVSNWDFSLQTTFILKPLKHISPTDLTWAVYITEVTFTHQSKPLESVQLWVKC